MCIFSSLYPTSYLSTPYLPLVSPPIYLTAYVFPSSPFPSTRSSGPAFPSSHPLTFPSFQPSCLTALVYSLRLISLYLTAHAFPSSPLSPQLTAPAFPSPPARAGATLLTLPVGKQAVTEPHIATRHCCQPTTSPVLTYCPPFHHAN